MVITIAVVMALFIGWYVPKLMLERRKSWYFSLVSILLAVLLAVFVAFSVVPYISDRTNFAEEFLRLLVNVISLSLIASVWSAIRHGRKGKESASHSG